MSEKIYRLNEGVCFCMSENICMKEIREDIPAQWRGGCFSMSERIYRLNERGLLLYVREDIPTQWKGVCFWMSENI